MKTFVRFHSSSKFSDSKCQIAPKKICAINQQTTKRAYTVVNPFTEKRFHYHFAIELPEFKEAKEHISEKSFNNAIASLSRASEIIEHTRGPTHEIVLETKEMLSRLFLHTEQYEEGIKASTQIIEATEKNKDAISKYINAHAHVIECLKMLERYDEAIGMAGSAAIFCREHAKWKEHASFILEIGSLFLLKGNLEEASKNINMAAQVIQEHHVKSPHTEAALENNWGYYHQAKGDKATAEEYFTKAHDIASKTIDDQLIADILANRGEGFIETGKYTEAKEALKRAIKLHGYQFPSFHFKVVQDTLLLGICCMNQKLYRTALDHASTALEAAEVVLDRDNLHPVIKNQYSAIIKKGLHHFKALPGKLGMPELEKDFEEAVKAATS